MIGIRRLEMAVVLGVAQFVANAGNCADRAVRGRELLSQNCAGCHAIGERDLSPVAAAPPFRSIGSRLDLDELFDRLQEGLFSAHRAMPAFKFNRGDAHAIRSYLNAIQR